jgi:tetratricopeptide (TPR) repeat protein
MAWHGKLAGNHGRPIINDKMNLQHTVIAATVLACATSTAPANGADQLTGKLIKAYNAGQYQSAEQLGERVVARHPTDYSARYYLANTYVLLHKNEQAIGQYRICLNSGTPGQLKQYSSTALERLLKQKEQALMAASQGEQPKDREIKEFKKKLHQETQQEQQRLRREWNQALEHVDDNYGFRRRGGMDFRRRSMDNYQDERYRINDTYSRRMAELAEHEESMLSQANCGTGKIRLAPSLSSYKVKNYINYGDESEAADIPVDNPLHAQARSLSDVAPQLPSSKGKPKARSNRKGAAKSTRIAAPLTKSLPPAAPIAATAKTSAPSTNKVAP